MLQKLLTAVVSFCCFVVLAHGAEPVLPASGVPAIAPDAFLTAYAQPQKGDVGSVEIAPADAPGTTRGLIVRTTGPAENPWSFQIQVTNSQPIKKGDALYVNAYFRAIQPSPETGEAQSQIVFENARSFDKSIDMHFAATREWKHVYAGFTSMENYAPDAAHFIFRASYPQQAYEIAGIELLNFGTKIKVRDLPTMPFTYAGREADAVWRVAALRRINEIRKGPLTVQVTNANGQPVAGAQVHVQMTRQAFLFGTAVAASMLRSDRTSPEIEKYRQVLLDNFNAATIENNLKWQGWDSQRAQAMEALRWLHDHHFNIRGHNLVWPSWNFMPRALRKYQDNMAPLRQIVLDHIKGEVTATRGLIDRWDVVNEPIANHVLMDAFGENVMVDWYKLVHQIDPKPLLCLNEYNVLSAGGMDQAHQDAFLKYLKDLHAAGAPLGAIGIQSHFGMDVTPPERVLKILDRFGALGMPMEITEYDMPGTDEKLQADYTRDFLIATFSHPDVIGFTMWGFWEGTHWRSESAMFRRNFLPKPAALAWHDLIYKDWWTDQTVATDARGNASLRGFLGDYDVTVTRNDQTARATVTLAKDGTHVQVTLK